ncbi:MAG: nucleotidyltransferase domain-containing protein [Candidatus Thermoplasmatota archaeon]|nr:nucleotidyltransferase domain-containing protein [Euryarchaeota archaeon]MBU4031957.1 nucleotidyltransferase domain-containing protein [Candidatus Thermoplasmatota archaeon]MBU4592838.1 nucleotidyltransferase domain-containing protein [Candidatus Thermoplasmatota archaeon]
MKEQDINGLAEFFQQQKDIKVAYVFGSEAKGSAGKLSDVDIAVYVDGSVSRKNYLGLKLSILGEISSILKTDRIDLVVMNNAPLLLNYNIIKFGKPLTSNEAERARLETKILSAYLDKKPMFEARTNAYLKKVAKAGLE